MGYLLKLFIVLFFVNTGSWKDKSNRVLSSLSDSLAILMALYIDGRNSTRAISERQFLNPADYFDDIPEDIRAQV